MNLLKEFFLFLREEKRWWLVPFLLVLALVGVLVFVIGPGAATVGAYPIW
ncbi:MAG: hypothetical protein HY608_08845 [Planctomycetes bacterium]|nr:hypothetical protein [Planctomycetota bacterium]